MKRKQFYINSGQTALPLEGSELEAYSFKEGRFPHVTKFSKEHQYETKPCSVTELKGLKENSKKFFFPLSDLIQLCPTLW